MAPEGKRRWEGGGGGGRSEQPYANKKTARPASFQKAAPPPRNQFTTMFEQCRDHLDAHHDRRERVVKASRDITALSKKIIFALQRVRRIHPELPRDVDREVTARLADIARLLAGIAPEMQGINRGRYGRVLFGMEELMEALTFLHYLKHQTLLSPEDGRAQVEALCRSGAKPNPTAKPEGEEGEEGKKEEEKKEEEKTEKEEEEETPTIAPDDNDYIMGVFDLSGEMMRFATTSAALRGELAGGSTDSRSIVGDMHELGSFFHMLPQRHDKSWTVKMGVLQTSVKKVERLGYDLRVRGSERPKGWIPEGPDVEASP